MIGAKPSSRWRRAIAVAYWVLIVLLAVDLLRVAGLKTGQSVDAKVKRQAVVATPYTMTQREVVTTAEGRSSGYSQFTSAMRADGSTVMVLGQVGRQSRTIHFASGLRVQTNETTRRMSSSHHEPFAQLNRDMSANCEKTGRGRRDTFAGVEAVAGIRTAKFIELASDRTATRWFALDYNCIPVQYVSDWSEGHGVSRTTLVSFVPGEPDKTLFELPSDFQEGPPSTLHFPDAKMTEFRQKWDEGRDRKYYAERPR